MLNSELDYEEIVWQLENCPITYLPALLIRLNQLVYTRKVLIPGGASRIALKVERKLSEQSTSDRPETADRATD